MSNNSTAERAEVHERGSRNALLEQLVTNTCSDGVFAVGLDQKIIFWNRAAQALLGFRSTEVLGQYCYDVIAGCNGNERRVCRQDCRECQIAKKRGVIPNSNLVTLNKAGKTIWINVSPMVVRTGELTTIIHVFRDITGYIEIKELLRNFSLQGLKLSLTSESELNLSGENWVSFTRLSSREQIVLRLIADGRDTKEIADELSISVATVKNHVQHIFTKLHVHSRLELLTLALRCGFLASSPGKLQSKSLTATSLSCDSDSSGRPQRASS
ncbi:MAG: PAS domain-containing protein [Acidobacteria bacterium]|nr:PAS domain-containing protein [Acidobacteriota bacterium]